MITRGRCHAPKLPSLTARNTLRITSKSSRCSARCALVRAAVNCTRDWWALSIRKGMEKAVCTRAGGPRHRKQEMEERCPPQHHFLRTADYSLELRRLSNFLAHDFWLYLMREGLRRSKKWRLKGIASCLGWL